MDDHQQRSIGRRANAVETLCKYIMNWAFSAPPPSLFNISSDTGLMLKLGSEKCFSLRGIIVLLSVYL